MVKTKLLLFISSAILLIGCGDMIVKPADSNLNVEDFNSAWERVNTIYPYLELKKINWDSVYLVYKPRAEQANGDEIYTVLIDMLGELKDMHVSVGTEGRLLIQTYHGPRWLKDKYSYNPTEEWKDLTYYYSAIMRHASLKYFKNSNDIRP